MANDKKTAEEIADVLVIGAGASGAAFTWSLAEAGINVVCLEQGGWVPTDAFPVSEADSQIHWQTDFHPDPGFRGLPEDYPINEDETPIAPLMYNAVGGSLIHWGAHFPRFHPSDFRVKTLEGVAEDWPVSYEELEPYYDENDRMMGVSGLKGDPAYPEKPERPCPPLSIRKSGQMLAKAFDKLGWHWWASDTAISSVHHHDRDPDVGGYLRSFATTDLTYWPPALKSGARLETYARVREITVDESGNATGVLYYQDGQLKEQKAKAVVLACNGVGTARLLLNSTSAQFPKGLANSSGLVGKGLMHHPVGSVLGIFDEELGTEDGGPRGSTMLSQEFYETNPDHDFIRGYDLQVLAYSDAPLAAAIGSLLGEKVAWGEGHHDEFKERFGHMIGITIMTEDLPEEHNTVTLDPELTDSDGIPAPKLNYTVSENTTKMLEHAVARATEVLEAAGAKKTIAQPLRRNAGWHLLGTARMGEDPATSVVDRWGRTHDVSNLFIIDGSIFTTSACVNPTPTIQALALRTADYLKGEGNEVIK